MPLHTKPEAEKNGDGNVWTVTQTAVVHTVTMIVMVMQQICTDYYKSVESLGGGVGCYKMFSLENYTSFVLLSHSGPRDYMSFF